MSLPSSSNHDLQPGTSEYEEWLRGWRSGNGDRAYEDAMRSAA